MVGGFGVGHHGLDSGAGLPAFLHIGGHVGAVQGGGGQPVKGELIEGVIDGLLLLGLETHHMDLGGGGAESQVQQAVILLGEHVGGHVGQALIGGGHGGAGCVVGEHQCHGAPCGAGDSGDGGGLKGDKNFR